jgi:hypothetical protein
MICAPSIRNGTKKSPYRMRTLRRKPLPRQVTVEQVEVAGLAREPLLGPDAAIRFPPRPS